MMLTLLSRAYCHLCDDMLAALRPLLAAHGARVEVIDVDAPEHSALEAAWGEKVPALFGGPPDAASLLCHYHLDAPTVERAIAAATADNGRGTGGNPL
jgi:hypothetical protein